MATIGKEGVDDLSASGVPFTIDLTRVDIHVRRMMEQGAAARTRVVSFEEEADAYPLETEKQRNGHMWSLGIAVPLTLAWLVVWVMVLGLVAVFSFAAVVAIIMLWVVMWFMVFAGATAMYTFRMDTERNPFAQALEKAGGNIWRWQGITLIYPLYVFPKFGFALITSFFMPDVLQPDEEDAYALRLMSDTRVLLALTVADDIKIVNQLAWRLRQEQAALRMNVDSLPVVDVHGLAALLSGMRETVLQKMEFLVLVFSGAELGDFHAELVDMMTANVDCTMQAQRFLVSDALQTDAVIELARLRVGLTR